MVGDTEFDVLIGRAAGMPTIGVTWGYHPRERLRAAGADLIIDGFDGSTPRWRASRSAPRDLGAAGAVLDPGDRRPEAGGFAVALDARPLTTPAGTRLVVPTAALATAIAAEWDALDGAIRPERLPLTRAANSAIDRVARARGGDRRDRRLWW